MTTRQQKPASLDRQSHAASHTPANRDLRGKLLTQPPGFRQLAQDLRGAHSGDGLPTMGEQAEQELQDCRAGVV